MKIRLHKGSLDESMKTVEEIPNDSVQALMDWRERHYPGSSGSIHLNAYGSDPRINWSQVFIVSDDNGVLGFSDSTLELSEDEEDEEDEIGPSPADVR